MLNERQRVIAQVLLRRRLSNLLRVDDDLYFDTSLITHIEYQLFLDAKSAEGKFHQPDHWQSFDFPKGEAKQPVVGVRPSDAQEFCDWLSQQSMHPLFADWRFRLPTAGETSQQHIHLVGRADRALAYWVQGADGMSIERLGGSLPSLSIDILARRIALDRALDRARARDKFVQRQSFFSRAYNTAFRIWQSNRQKRVGNQTSDSEKEISEWLDQALDIYLDLLILDERRNGNLPAFEGILIVKEKKQNG